MQICNMTFQRKNRVTIYENPAESVYFLKRVKHALRV